MSPEALEARRLGGIARQEALGDDGRTEYARDRAKKRWGASKSNATRYDRDPVTGRFTSRKTKAA